MLLALVAGAVRLGAQELSAQAGTMGTGGAHGASYAWQLEYREPFADHFAWSAAWINEGHADSHHRDGLAAELWANLWSEPEQFDLAFGAGAYHYADTVFQRGDGYANVHGTTAIFSVSATYYTNSPWFFRVTGNHINQSHGFGTHTLVAGAGYRLGWKPHEAAVHAPRERAANALFALGGRTIVNSRSSDLASATMIEYRRAIGHSSDWTLAYLDEGDPHIMHREGVATQLWLVDAYLQRRFSVGIGMGPYYYFQREGPPTENFAMKDNWAIMVSPTAAYRLFDGWQARLTWNRVISRDDRDADVIVVGLGYYWGTK